MNENEAQWSLRLENLRQQASQRILHEYTYATTTDNNSLLHQAA